MALNVGDVFYKIRADVGNLTKAIKTVDKLATTAEKAAKSLLKVEKSIVNMAAAVKTVSSASASASGRMATMAKTAASAQAKAADKASAALLRQKKAIVSVQGRLDNFLQSAFSANFPEANINKLSDAFAEFEKKMKSGALSSKEYTEAQIKMRRAFSDAQVTLRAHKQIQSDQIRQIKQLANAQEQLANIQQRAQVAGASPVVTAELASRAQRAFDSYQKTLKKSNLSSVEAAKASAKFQKRLNVVNREIRALEKGMHSTQNLFSSFAQGIKSVGTAFAAFLIFQTLQDAVIKFFGTFDLVTKMSGQLRIITKDQEEFNSVFSELGKIAIRTRSDLASVTTLYGRLAASILNAGGSTKEALDVTEAITAALTAGSNTATEAASVMVQLSQAFIKGKLDGDELRAMLEASTPLVNALGEELKVTAGEVERSTDLILSMAKNGKLSMAVLTKALLKAKDGLVDMANVTNISMSQAVAILNTKFVLMIKNLKEFVDVGGGVSNIILSIADNLETLAIAFGALTGFGIASIFTKLTNIIVGTVAGVGALVRKLIVFGKTASKLSRFQTVMALLPGLFKLLGLAVGAAVAALAVFSNKTVQVGSTTATVGEVTRTVWNSVANAISDATENFTGFLNKLKNTDPKNLSTVEKFLVFMQNLHEQALELGKSGVKSALGFFLPNLESDIKKLQELEKESKKAKFGGALAKTFENLPREIKKQALFFSRDYKKIIEKLIDKKKQTDILFQKALSPAALVDITKPLTISITSKDFIDPRDFDIASKALDVIVKKMQKAGFTFKEIDKLSKEGKQQVADFLLALAGEAPGTGDVNTAMQLLLEKMIKLQKEAKQAQVAIDFKNAKRSATEISDAMGKLNNKFRGNTKAIQDSIKVMEMFRSAGIESVDQLNKKLHTNFTSLEEARDAWLQWQEDARKENRVLQAIDEIRTTLNQTVEDFVLGAISIEDAWKNVEQQILRTIARQAIIEPFVNTISSGIGDITAGFGKGIGAKFASFFTGGASGTGGIGASGTFANPAFNKQAGGVVKAGQIVRVGESGTETFVPAINGRIVPASQSVGGEVNVQIIDQRGANAPPPQVQQSIIDGKRQISVMIKSEFQQLTDSGALDSTFNRNFGLNRRAR